MISEIKIDKNKLYEFIDLKQIANFGVMKCIKLFFSINGIRTNIGFYYFIPTIIVYIIALFKLYQNELKRIMDQINEIISAKKLILYSKGIKIPNKNIKKSLSLFTNYLAKKKVNIEKEEDFVNRRIISKKNKKKIIEDSSFSSRNEIISKKSNIDDNNSKDEKNKSNNDSTKFILKLNKVSTDVLTKQEKKRIVEILKFNDTELNELGYRKAFKFDLRNYKQYYLSLLFTKHTIFKIFNKTDYNSFSIKILLLFFDLSSCFAVNALFFNDNTMHQIYEDEGSFNFIYQLPQIVYSLLISFFIDNIITFLALSEEDIIELKKDKNLDNLEEKGKRIKTTLKIKFISFFIISIFFILLFWYYTGCFCAVYKNTQFHLIKDTIISLLLSYITPLGCHLLTSLLRIYSLKQNTSSNRVLFRLSRFFQKWF